MSKNVARSEYSQQDILQVYPFPFVFIFLLTACNKIKIHRGNEIKERYKIFENKAELESFWNDENIIKRSKFPRKKILRRNDNINAFYLSSISLKIVFFGEWMEKLQLEMLQLDEIKNRNSFEHPL